MHRNYVKRESTTPEAHAPRVLVSAPSPKPVLFHVRRLKAKFAMARAPWPAREAHALPRKSVVRGRRNQMNNLSEKVLIQRQDVEPRTGRDRSTGQCGGSCGRTALYI